MYLMLWLQPQVKYEDASVMSQMWLCLSCTPSALFIFSYVPPVHLNYFVLGLFSIIQKAQLVRVAQGS